MGFAPSGMRNGPWRRPISRLGVRPRTVRRGNPLTDVKAIVLLEPLDRSARERVACCLGGRLTWKMELCYEEFTRRGEGRNVRGTFGARQFARFRPGGR